MRIKLPFVGDDHKYNSKFNRTINTTTDFGFLQPLICRELSSKDTLNFAVGHEVQFAPMPAPTFGQVDLKAYHCFVPIESIYHPYGSLMKGEVYRGSNETYIPQTVITTSNAQLFTIGKVLSIVTLYEITGARSSSNGINFDDRKVVINDNVLLNDLLSVVLDKFDGYFSTGQGELQGSFCPTIYGTQELAKNYFAGYDETDRDDLKYYDWFDVIEYEDESVQTFLVCGKYSHAGRNWRTICQGLGYKFNNSGNAQTFLKLLAWYKAYYELFYPKRDLTWKATYGAAIQEWCEQYGVFDLLDGQSFLKYDLLGNFVKDVVRSYYCGNPDWISAHITGMSTQTAGQTDYIEYLNAAGGSSSVGTGAANTQARLAGGNTTVLSNMLTKSALDLLNALSTRINVRTALGGRIREYLKSQLGSEYFEEDKYMSIGADSIPMFVEKIMNQAQTAEGDLGEFAGRGQSEGNGESYSFTAPEVGFWITMFTVVPRGHYCQGVDRDCGHIAKYDFFDKKFDSLTLVPTRKMYIYGEQEFTGLPGSGSGGLDSSFGNIPNYSEYCTVNDLINGDIARPSKRASFLAYTMQKLLPYTAVISVRNNVDERPGSIQNLDMSVVVNGIIWRFINLVPWLGIFNRMFLNSGRFYNNLTEVGINAIENHEFWHTPGQDDNFIVNAVINFSIDGLKLPLQDSFQTDGFDSNFTVEKS